LTRNEGRIEISNTSLHKYLEKNKLKKTFLIINQSVITCDARYSLFKERADYCRNLILTYRSPDQNVTLDIVRLQLLHLDMLANIFMLLEDFLGHSSSLRFSLKEFPYRIASRNDRTASDEIEYLRKLKLRDVSSYLLHQNISGLNGNESKLLQENYRNMRRDILKRIRKILEFHSRYYRVYIKYKHILPVVLGIHHKKYNIGQSFEVSNSFIYIRDFQERKKKPGIISRKRNKFHTYIVLASGLEPLTYYESIMDDIKLVYTLILISYVNHMCNMGKPFVIPITEYVESYQREKLTGIIRKANTLSITSPTLDFRVNIESPLKEKLEDKLPKETIYRLRRDILSGTK
jgi:hypothetical protein